MCRALSETILCTFSVSCLANNTATVSILKYVEAPLPARVKHYSAGELGPCWVSIHHNKILSVRELTYNNYYLLSSADYSKHISYQELYNILATLVRKLTHQDIRYFAFASKSIAIS